MSKPELNADARSPMAGCTILIVAMLVMVFLIVFSTVALFRQFNAIAKFTGEVPEKIEVSKLDGNEAALNRLSERLELFRQQLGREEGARLELAPEEINLAIAAFDSFAELRGTFRVESIKDGAMQIRISFPLNGKPRLARKNEGGLVASDSRYLNAMLIAEPCLLKREVVMRIHEIQVPGAKVPDEFIQQMSPYRLMERYLVDPVLGPAMGKFTRVGLEDGKLVLTKVPGEIPVDAITDEQVDYASSRFMKVLGTAACVFLVFAGTLLFIGMRKKNADA